MFNARRLFLHLSKKYCGKFDFKNICNDENIVILKECLGLDLNGFYCCSGLSRIIVLNKNISYCERRDWGWHELYHHFMSIDNANSLLNIRDERNATFFASLVRCPHIEIGDTVESVMDKYSASYAIAEARIEFELNQLAA